MSPPTTTRQVTLAAPLTTVLTPAMARKFEQELGLRTVEDLLRHYPRRYYERGDLTPLSELRMGEHVTVLAEVQNVETIRYRNRAGQRVVVTVTDGVGRLQLVFFNPKGRMSWLSPGRRGLFDGRVTAYRGTLQLAHPHCHVIDDDSAAADWAGALVPIYRTSDGCNTWTILERVKRTLALLADVPDPLPAQLRLAHRVLSLREAFDAIHQPADFAAVTRARRRFKWDEAFHLQVTLAQRRAAARQLPTTPRPPTADGLLVAFDARLPFQLTAGQREVSAQILADLAASNIMFRLLQGEVGSGKTVVALRAMLAVVDTGGQAALLAPTEVLAQQHARTIRALLGPLAAAGELGAAERATSVVLLSGSSSPAARRHALAAVADGSAGIVVGTHALLEEQVQFRDLGLVVVDEQHRFGVEQRDALRTRGTTPPHVLVMTATPIPRTVAMTVFGDLETSELREIPAGRQPVSTSVVPVEEKPTWYDRVWARVREEVAAGHQVYVVCPRIGGDADPDDTDVATDEDEQEEAAKRPTAAVLDVLPMLAEDKLAGLRVAALHGRLPAEAKDAAMSRFAAAEVDVLVATTVIEVGVDVPNATAMVVLDADRFGVSQLHQLRGRVGRGSAPGLCLLVTHAAPDSPARVRLEAVAATTDGFELARLDLQQRREGDVLGVAQSGRRRTLRMLSLLEDEELILAARDEAVALVDRDPDLSRHPVLAASIARVLDQSRAEFLDKV